MAEVDLQLRERDSMLANLKFSLLKAQQRMVAAANGKRWDIEFKVDDWVYVKLHPYRQSSLMKHAHPKLAPQFIGPFQILAHVDVVAYRLALPDGVSIHPVFMCHYFMKLHGIICPFFLFHLPCQRISEYGSNL